MAEIKKVLFVLDASNKWNRILRRGVVIGVLTFVAIIIKNFIPDTPDIWIPVLTGLLALIDKGIRELQNNK